MSWSNTRIDLARLPAYLLQLRRDRGLSQVEVAETLGMSNNNLSRYETGKTVPLERLIDLLNHYDQSLFDLAEALQPELKPERQAVTAKARKQLDQKAVDRMIRKAVQVALNDAGLSPSVLKQLSRVNSLAR